MADRLDVPHGVQRRRNPSKRNTPIPTGGTSSVLGHRKSNLDTKSVSTPDINKLKHVANTYKMDPQERFEVSKMESLMSEILETRLRDVGYCGDTCSELSKELACTIISKSKAFKWERYKMVAQVMVGQNDNQDVRVASRCVWDQKTDTFACVSYRNASLFAVASCYGVYFE